MDDSKILDRAVQAEKLLKHPLLIEAFELLKQAISQKWESSPVRDIEAREKLFLMLKATNDARGYLEQAVRDGKVELHSREERRLFKIFQGRK